MQNKKRYIKKHFNEHKIVVSPMLFFWHVFLQLFGLQVCFVSSMLSFLFAIVLFFACVVLDLFLLFLFLRFGFSSSVCRMDFALVSLHLFW